MLKLLVIGESCLDVFNYGKCDRMCPDAPVPIFVSTKTKENEGMAMNVANNVSSLGVECDIITNKNWREVTKTRYIDDKTNQMLLRIDEGDDKVGECELEFAKEHLEQYDAIIISDYSKGFLGEEKIEEISLAHNNVFLDTKKLLGPWCSSLKYIKINYYEHERTRHLINDNIKNKLIVTLGSNGCKHKENIYSVPAVEIKDSSGGGDTFIAGLVAKYLETNDIREAIKFANECATKVVQRRGVSVV